MSNKSQKDKLDFIVGVIGELILFIPLILFCVWINQLYPCISGMILLFSYKHLYKHDLEHFDKSIKCVSLTYFVLISIVFIYAGIGAFIPSMGEQPLLIIIIVGIVAYLNTCVGEIQFSGREKSKRIEELKTENEILQNKIVSNSIEKEGNKDIHKLCESDLRTYCRHKGLNSRQIDIVVAKVIYQIKGESLEDYMYSLPNNYRTSLRTINRDIVVIKNKLNINKI